MSATTLCDTSHKTGTHPYERVGNVGRVEVVVCVWGGRG